MYLLALHLVHFERYVRFKYYTKFEPFSNFWVRMGIQVGASWAESGVIMFRNLVLSPVFFIFLSPVFEPVSQPERTGPKSTQPIGQKTTRLTRAKPYSV